MKKIVAMASIAMLWTSGAWALGTEAGTSIGNDATLSYSAGGVSQPDVQADVPAGQTHADEFVVDKKIDMVLVTTDSDQLDVSPGQTDKITNYEFKNEGNSDENFKFEVANLPNGQEADYDNDQDNENTVNTMDIEYSTDGGNTWTALPNDGIVNVAQDITIQLRVKADIPAAPQGANGDIMNIELKATAYKDDKSSPETETAGQDNKTQVDVVFADGETVQNGSDTNGLGATGGTKGDTAGDGMDVARSGYIIQTPVLSLKKLSCVYSDPVTGGGANSANAKRIPGAYITYVFDIENTGNADASGITVTDTLDSHFVYNQVSDIKDVYIDKDSDNACVCDNGVQHGHIDQGTGAAGTNTGTAPEVKIENIDVAQSKHTCVSFRAEID